MKKAATLQMTILSILEAYKNFLNHSYRCIFELIGQESYCWMSSAGFEPATTCCDHLEMQTLTAVDWDRIKIMLQFLDIYSPTHTFFDRECHVLSPYRPRTASSHGLGIELRSSYTQKPTKKRTKRPSIRD